MMAYNCEQCSTSVSEEDNYCSTCKDEQFWCDDCEHMTGYGEQRICIYCDWKMCDYHYDMVRGSPWYTSCCNACICDGCHDQVVMCEDKMICKGAYYSTKLGIKCATLYPHIKRILEKYKIQYVSRIIILYLQPKKKNVCSAFL